MGQTGKDPVAAVLSIVELVGPCRFGWWVTEHDLAEDDEGEFDMLAVGDPFAVANPTAWIQIAAVSKDQTRNTMTLFPSMISDELKRLHKIDIGKEIIYAYGGARRIEAVTSNPRSLEGGRPTFVIQNETHHWLANNEGHEMAAVSERNSTKAAGGAARTLSITNAYEPSEDSVAQQEREAYEKEATGQAIKTGVMYDSVEAPPNAMLFIPADKETGREPTEAEIKAYIGAVIRAVRGDATWLDVEGIVNSILDRKNPPSRSRRFWYNQIVASEDAWLEPRAVDAAVDPLVADARRFNADDVLRAGWLVMPNEPVVAFLDCSKSDDATAMVGCRLSDGFLFTLGIWAKPPGDAGKGWVVSREAVDSRFHEVMERFNVVAFWGDPSHTKDDDSTRFWDGVFDAWHRKYKEKLQVHAVKTGDRQSATMWDMTSPERHSMFVAAAEEFGESIQNEGPDGYDSPFKHDGHPALVEHLKNARRYPTKYGISLWKGHRESAKKIDLAVAAVGARMLARIVLNRGLEEPEKSKAGDLWGAWA